MRAILRLSPFCLVAACTGAPSDRGPAPSAVPSQPVAATTAGVHPAEAPADVILVLEDGLRSDIGGPGAEAALFDALAAAAPGHPPLLRYTNASAQSVQAFLSIGSILTGRYPSAVPICSLPVGPKVTSTPWCVQIPASVPTIPGFLSIYGYSTALVVTPPSLREHDQIAGEFGAVFVSRDSEHDGLGSAVDNSLAWWTKSSGTPRFLMIVDDLAAPVMLGAPSQLAPGEVDTVVPKLRAAYSEGAAARGKELGRLLVAASAGTTRETWMIVTAAHGVSIGETTGTPSLPIAPVQHDILLERTLHVPLAIFGPASAGSPLVVPEVRELTDIAPTIAHLGRALPPAGLTGRDLFETAPPTTERVAYAEFGDMLAGRSQRYLLMARLWMHGGTALDPEITRKLRDRPSPGSTFTLHDIVADPMQTTNLVSTDPKDAATMYDALLALRTGPAAPPQGGLTQDQVAKLRSSGALNYW